MVKLRYLLQVLTERFTSTFLHEASVNVFCKALYIFLFIKVLLNWATPELILNYVSVRQSASFIGNMILLPGHVASANYPLFVTLFLAFIACGIVIKRNYLVATIVTWFAWNFYVITFPASNGSDYILIILLVFSIPMSSYPRANDEIRFFMQKVGHNAAVVMCQIQVALIYLISGLNKIESELWRTGDAVQHINRIDFLSNPNLSHLLGQGELIPFLISWFTILFELTFPILIWFREYRIFVLIAGVIFHLGIAIFLSLPDFGAIMIIAYIPFLTNMVVLRQKKVVTFKRDKTAFKPAP
jgi:hypothetical protein